MGYAAVNQYEACTCRQSISQQVDVWLRKRKRERKMDGRKLRLFVVVFACLSISSCNCNQ